MKKGLMAIGTVALLSVGFQTGPRSTREVEILLVEGVEVTGEILAVRDSSIVVGQPAGLTDDKLQTLKHSVLVFPFFRVAQIGVPGESYVGTGAIVGMGIGCLVGGLIGKSQPTPIEFQDDMGPSCTAQTQQGKNIWTGMALGGVGGAAVGAVAGSVLSESDSLLVSPTQRDFAVLKRVARYPVQEPDYLKSR